MKKTLIAIVILFASCGSHTSVAARHDENTVWYLRSISPDGKTISIVYTMSGVASGCEKQGKAVVTAGAGKVVVHAVKSVIDDKNTPCTEELGYFDDSVTLSEPLGNRSLIGCRPDHAAASEDKICRDLKRGRDYGIPPSPSA